MLGSWLGQQLCPQNYGCPEPHVAHQLPPSGWSRFLEVGPRVAGTKWLGHRLCSQEAAVCFWGLCCSMATTLQPPLATGGPTPHNIPQVPLMPFKPLNPPGPCLLGRKTPLGTWSSLRAGSSLLSGEPPVTFPDCTRHPQVTQRPAQLPSILYRN